MVKKYDASSIDINLGLDVVRAAPQVYIGSPDSHGLFVIFKEPVDNSTDECEEILRGIKEKIVMTVGVSIDTDGYIWVYDAGRGIPIEKHKVSGISTFTSVLTMLSAGAKMRGKSGDAAYKKCFVGSTKIKLVDGTVHSLEWLAKNKKDFWVFASDKNGWIVPAKAHSARITTHTKKMVKVYLDNGKIETCTPDHLWMLRSGLYRKAKNLKPNTSLMPLYTKRDRQKHLLVKTNCSEQSKFIYPSKVESALQRKRNGYIPFYLYVGYTKFGFDKNDFHHKDFNPKNDVPNNLICLTKSQHTKLHSQHNNENEEYVKNNAKRLTVYAQSKEGRKNSSLAGTTYGKYYLAEYTNSVANRIDKSIKAKKNNTVHDFKRAQQFGKVMRCYLYISLKLNKSFSEKSYEEYKQWSSPGWNTLPKEWKDPIYLKSKKDEYLLKRKRAGEVLPGILAAFKPCNKLRMAENINNHKVLKIEYITLEKAIPMYDIEVPEYHNFALNSGVFVHNSAGVHGMGISIANALSTSFTSWTFRDGKWWTQDFKKGKIVSGITKTTAPIIPLAPKSQAKRSCGTVVRFHPDSSMFDKGSKLNHKQVKNFLKLQSYLHPYIKFVFADKDGIKTYHEPDGMLAYVKDRLASKEIEPLGNAFTIHSADVDCTLQWAKCDFAGVESYVNGSPTKDGGSHITGLYKALADSIAPFAGKRANYKTEDLVVGLIGVLNFGLASPTFTGQTKDKLATPEANQVVYEQIRKPLDVFWNKNKSLARDIVKRAVDIRKVMSQSTIDRKSAAELRSKEGNQKLSAKYARATTKNLNEIELFLVEGDSAAGCFVGSTKVKLINGKNKSLKRLVEDSENGIINYGYAHSNKTGVHIVPIDAPRLVKYTKLLTEVTLDNNEVVRCTRSHEWKLRDGSYLRADKLKRNTSLMPCYERIIENKGKRRQIWSPNPVYKDGTPKGIGNYRGAWKYVHRSISKDLKELNSKRNKLENKGIIVHVHHHDENTLNDAPNNLRILSARNHRLLHGENTTAYANFKKGAANTHAILMKSDPVYKKKHTKMLKKAMSKFWSDPTNRQLQSIRTTKHMADPKNREIISKSVKNWWNKDRRKAQAIRAKNQSSDVEYQNKRRLALKETRKNKFLEIVRICAKINFASFAEAQKEWIIQNNTKRLPFKNGFLAWREFYSSYRDFSKELEKDKKVYNHKVKSVRNIVLKKAVPVYDASISTYCNYALSAGVFVHNTAKLARDGKYQAVLPLKGKVLNAYGPQAGKGKLLSNAEVLDILRAIIVEPATGEKKSALKFKVGKVIVLTDPDVDGKHITVLLFALFQRVMPELFKQNMVYMVSDVPLFNTFYKNKRYFGETLDDVMRQLPKGTKLPEGVQRIKGWGEVGPEIISELAFIPKTRKLTQAKPLSDEELPIFVGMLSGEGDARKLLVGL